MAALLAAFTSCQKDDIVAEDNIGVPMTLTVSIGDLTTRTAYSDAEGGLKVEWKAGDQVSVVSYNSNGNSGILQSCDTFTATGSGNSTTFTGTYTGSADAPLIRVVYPALTETRSISDVTGWATPAVSGRYTQTPVFVMSTSTCYSRFNLSYMNQLTDNDPSHLKYYDSMTGTATLDGNSLSASLHKNISVFKVVINTSNIPAGTVMKYVRLSSNMGRCFGVAGWSYSTRDFNNENSGSFYPETSLFLGSNSTGAGGETYVTGITKTDGDDELVVYIPNIRMNSAGSYAIAAGNTFSVGITVTSGKSYEKQITLTDDFIIEVGKVNTIKATVK